MPVSRKLLFLLCNDDGVHAPGLAALGEAVAPLGEVYIVAPSMERSATSQSLTISSPLRLEALPERSYSKHVFEVNGSPADSVKLALAKVLPRKPDWVLSGINRGGNLGYDTLYSGTVGAAMEALLNGCKAMAISCHRARDAENELAYETAGKVVTLLLGKAEQLAFAHHTMLNVNVPSVRFSDLRGIVAATLGRRIYDSDYIEAVDPRGQPYYWLGADTTNFEDIAGSDRNLVYEGFATVSPLQASLLHPELTAQLDGVLSSMFGEVFY